MKTADTLVDLLPGREETETSGIRFLLGEQREAFVRYGELARRAGALLHHFQAAGAAPGDPVLLFVRNNIAFIDAFWACQLGGLVPVPLSAGVHLHHLRKLAAVAGQFDGPILFTERELLQRYVTRYRARPTAPGCVCLVEDVVAFDAEAPRHATAPQDTALIQFSSGSTGEPKGVVLSHANLLANIGAISRAAAIDASDVTLSWMPLSHDMGLIGFHLVPLFNAVTQVLMPTEQFLRQPSCWLQSAQRMRATLLCSPNFGYRHYLDAAAAPEETLDLSHVRLIFNGAEPISAPLCRDFCARLAASGLDAGAMFPVYGLAEASLAVSFVQPGTGVQALRLAADRLAVGARIVVGAEQPASVERVSVGQPLPGCEISIRGRDGRPLADDTVGHIHIRGASVTRGYHGRLPAADGWLDTGDLGFRHDEQLYVTGRDRDLLFVHGQNWYPEDLEHLLHDHVGVTPGRVAVAAGRSGAEERDRVLVFVQYRRGLDGFQKLADEVCAVLGAHAGVRADAVIPVARLPRTSSGKLQRHRLAAAFARGEYDRSVSASVAADAGALPDAATHLERELLDICQRVFAGRRLTRDQNLFELGADSLTLVRVHDEIEARYPGRVAVTDMFDHPTVAALSVFLARP